MAIYLDELEVGQVFETESRTVTAADVEAFAHLTGDLNPVHLDDDYARHTPFGRRVAHGMLTLSIAAGLLSPVLVETTVAAHGIDDLRFRRPLYLDQRVRVVARVVETKPVDEQKGILRIRCQVFDEEGKVVMLGTVSTIMLRRPAGTAE